jgi:hypothetical protein
LKKLFEWSGILLVATISTMAFVGLLLFLRAFGEPLWTQEASGWAQAIGSVAALGVAIYVMSRQNEHSARLVADADRLAALRRAQAIHALVKRVNLQFNNVGHMVLGFTREPGEIEVMRRKFKVAAEVFQNQREIFLSLPVHELASFDIADAIWKLTDTLQVYMRMVEALRDSPESIADPRLHPSFHDWHAIIEDAVKQFERGLASLKA